MTAPLLPHDAPVDGDLVVVTDDDVLAVLPAFVRESDSAPVRDGIVAAIREMLMEAQRRGSYAAAQADILRATGIYLDGLGADRGVFRQLNEDDSTYRARILAFPDLVTPAAILAAANAILARITTITAKYLEQLDAWFVGDGTTVWSSHVFDGTTNATPRYLDRLYADDSADNGGAVCEGRAPGGARAFSDHIGRYFELRVPDLAPIDSDAAYVSASPIGSDGNPTPDGFFCGTGGSDHVSFVGAQSDTEFDVYNAIATSIERIKGHSMRWTLYVDPLLVA